MQGRFPQPDWKIRLSTVTCPAPGILRDCKEATRLDRPPVNSTVNSQSRSPKSPVRAKKWQPVHPGVDSFPSSTSQRSTQPGTLHSPPLPPPPMSSAAETEQSSSELLTQGRNPEHWARNSHENRPRERACLRAERVNERVCMCVLWCGGCACVLPSPKNITFFYIKHPRSSICNSLHAPCPHG